MFHYAMVRTFINNCGRDNCVFFLMWILVVLSVCFRVVSSTLQDDAFCGFVASTSIESTYAEWSCGTNGAPTTDPCGTSMWTGVVSCDNNGFVTDINIQSVSLSGSLSTNIAGLSTLTSFELYDLSLSGTLPDTIGQMTALSKFAVFGNCFSGTIPTTFGLLTGLSFLRLQSNRLTGTIPAEISLLTDLVYFYSYYNSLTGSIPSMLSSLVKVQNFMLCPNQLTGTIPSQLSQLASLQYLDMSNCKLTGTIPVELGALTNMVMFFPLGNLLTGSLPSELCSSGSLTSLYANSGNYFSCYADCLSTVASHSYGALTVCADPSVPTTGPPSAPPTSYPSPVPVGGISFTEIEVAISVNAYFIQAIDLDLDGDLDLVAALNTDNAIGWYENDGSGSFTEHVIAVPGASVPNVYVADLDRDGDLDIIASSDVGVNWFENDGLLGFTQYTVAGGVNMWSIVSADLDGDGDMDIISSNSGGSTLWFENDGTQIFTTHIIDGSGGGLAIQAVDLDNDGDMDVVAAMTLDDEVAVFENDGQMGFTRVSLSAAFADPQDLEVVDIDGDGYLDIVVVSKLENQVGWLRNDGTQNFTFYFINGDFTSEMTVSVVDFDGDGFLDVVTTSEYSVVVFLNDGTGVNFSSVIISSTLNGGRGGAVGDFDGNGLMDAASTSTNTGTITWYQTVVFDENATFVPSGPPTWFPTATAAVPTELPTNSPTPFFNNFYFEYEIVGSYGRSLDFSMYSNSVDEYKNQSVNWLNFIDTTVESVKSTIEYYSIMNVTYAEMNSKIGSTLSNASIICTDVNVVQDIMRGMLGGYSVKNQECNGRQWGYVDGNICIDCSSNITDTTSICSDIVTDNSIAIPHYSSSCDGCSGLNTCILPSYVKGSYYFGIADTIPIVQEINVESVTNSSIAVVVNTSVPNSLVGTGSSAETNTSDNLATQYYFSVTCAIFLLEDGLNSTMTSSLIRQKGSTVYMDLASYGENNTVQLDFKFDGLIAVMQYVVYCFASDNFHSLYTTSVGSNVFSTECCRQIEFSSIPSQVFGNISLVLNSLGVAETSSIIEANTVWISLPTTPEVDIVVTPLLFDVNNETLLRSNAVSDNVSANPPLLYFKGTNSSVGSLLGSFMIQGSGGLYAIDFNITSVQAGYEYVAAYFSGPTANIELLAAAVPPAAPRLSKARISDSGVTFSISFTKATDVGVSVINSTNTSSAGEIWSCSILFSFVNVTDYQCRWTNASNVQVSPVEGSVPTHNTLWLVTLLSNTIRAACVNADCTDYPYASSMNVTVASPYTPVVPVPLISMPASVGACNDLSVDATSSIGSGGRAWLSISWAVVSTETGVEVEELSDLLNSYGADVMYVPVKIPSASLNFTTYAISLTLTNYLLEVASITSLVSKLTSNLVPTAVISGSKAIESKASAAINLYGKGQLSKCSSSATLSFNWELQRTFANGTSVSLADIYSKSKSPLTFSLYAYTLVPGYTYKLILEVVASVSGSGNTTSAYASVSIDILSGDVIALISGGSTKAFPIDVGGDIDASSSYDEGNADGSDLTFQWSCVVRQPISLYGEGCSSLLWADSSSSSVAVVAADTMVLDYYYEFSCVVSSADGRTDEAVVLVVADPTGNPEVDISYSSGLSKIDPSHEVYFNSVIYSRLYAVSATWSLSTATSASASSTEVSLVDLTLTNYSRSFTVVQTSTGSGMNFPILLQKDSLTAGIAYTFAITVTPTSGQGRSSYSSITLYTNAPPSSGSFVVSPTEGNALDTEFLFSSPSWTDDLSDYPLLYDFSYYVKRSEGSQSSVLYVASRIVQSIAYSVLPAGLDNFDNIVVCGTRIRDALGAHSSLDFAVNVTLQSTSSVEDIISAYAGQALAEAAAESDTSAITQIVNSVGSMFSTVNCTFSPNCTLLHRLPCSDVPHTCGDCADGFSGLVGSHNFMCIAPTDVSALAVPGESCNLSIDCLYGWCVNGMCSYPNKLCWSNIPRPLVYDVSSSEAYQLIDNEVTCSGSGECSWFDVSNSLLGSSENSSSYRCTVDDANCQARCVCNDGYGGVSCSQTIATLEVRSAVRGSLCEALNNVSNIQDHSNSWLLSLVSSLSVAFDPYDMVYDGNAEDNEDLLALCNSALVNIATLVYNGQLGGGDDISSLTTLIASTSSAFVEAVLLLDSLNRTGNSQSSSTSDIAVNTTTALLAGTQSAMVPGQYPMNIVSSNIRATVLSTLIEDIESTISLPMTEEEEYYAASTTDFSITDAGLDSCYRSRGLSYVSFSLTNWGNNPYENSSQVKSKLFRMGGSVSDEGDSSGEYAEYDEMQYSMILQLNTPLQGELNESLVSCASRNAGDNGYGACDGCRVLSHTATNATLGCYNTAGLCYNSARRRLADDETSTSVAEFGMLATGIADEVSSTLSINPFANIDEAAPALAFMTGLGFVFALGFVYFRRWDRHDALVLKYLVSHQYEKGLDPDGEVANVVEMTPAAVQLELVQDDRYVSGASKEGADLLRSGFRYAAQEDAFKSSGSGVTKNSYMYHPSFSKSVSERKRGHARLADADRTTKGASAYESLHKSVLHYLSHHFITGRVQERYSMPERVPDSDDENSEDEYPPPEPSNAAGPCSTDDTNPEEPVALSISRTVNKCAGDANPLRKPEYLEMLKNFFDDLLPPLIAKDSYDSKIRGLKNAMLRNHDCLAPFTFASMNNPRTARWVGLMSGLLVALFLNSLFYGLFFPPAQCELYQGYSDCMNVGTSVASGGDTICIWNDVTQQCSTRPPPSSTRFIVIVALVVIICEVPFSILIYLLSDMLFCRPDFTNVPLLGHLYPLNRLAPESLKNANDKSSILKMALLHGAASGNYCGSISTNECTRGNRHRRSALAHDDLYFNRAVRLTYNDTLSCEEEAQHVVNMLTDELTCKHLPELAEAHHNDSFFRGRRGVPNSRAEVMKSAAASRKKERARVRMKHEFNLRLYGRNYGGYLNMFSRVNQSKQDLLPQRLRQARLDALNIRDDLLSHESSKEVVLDSLLLQHFLLEQFTGFKKTALKNQMFVFDQTLPDVIDGWHFLLAWATMIALWLFCLYWMLAWGVRNNGEIMQSFFVTFFVGLIQDLLTTQPIKIVITALIPSYAMKDQLYGIVGVLRDSFITHAKGKEGRKNREMLTQSKVVDAAHSIQVVHHFSPSCRAARAHSAYKIPAAAVLRNLTDEDLLSCQTFVTSRKDSPTAMFFVAVVGAFALFGDFQGDQLLDIMLSAVFSGFILFNELLWEASLYLFFAFYVILISWLMYMINDSLPFFSCGFTRHQSVEKT